MAAVKDFRRAQGRKHTVASVLAVYILARLANFRGPVAAAEYAQQLSQAELRVVGTWKSPRTGRHVPVSKSTLHRVTASADSEQIEAVLRRFTMPLRRRFQGVCAAGNYDHHMLRKHRRLTAIYCVRSDPKPCCGANS